MAKPALPCHPRNPQTVVTIRLAASDPRSLDGKFAQPTSSDPSLRLWECVPDKCSTSLLQLLPQYGFCSRTDSSNEIRSPPHWGRPLAGSTWRLLHCWTSTRWYQKTPPCRRLHNQQPSA